MRKILLLLCLLVFSFTKAQTVVYVDVDATGTNDGTSWANAYNSLHDALTNTTTAGAEIWIAEGTYTPSSVSTPFLNQYGVNIFGGFVGTEATRADRNVDPWLHPVYLSGDINGDDLNEVPSASSANKSDNATRILQIEPTTVSGTTLNHVQENIVIDRINFVNAYGGSALYSHPAIGTNYTQNEITIDNCRFARNYAATRPAFDIWANIFGGTSQNPIKTFSLLNSIVDENVSQVGFAFEYRGLQDYDKIFIGNNLFIANKVEDAGKSGSVARFISNGAQGVSVFFNNNTLSLNQEGSGVAASESSCIRLQRTSGGLGGAWYNNIYFNNIGTTEFVGFTTSGVGINFGSTNARDFTPTNDVSNSIFLPTTPFVDISTGNFEPLAAYRQNGTMGGFGGYNFSDFPATDCFQNGRTYSSGTVIGLGAVQHANTAMFHGPGNIASLSLPAPIGDIFVDAGATGNNDGTSWADAYNSLYDALNSTSFVPGGKVFVKAGTYYATTGGFTVSDDNVQIFGGFSGTETDETERDMSLIYTTNATIISGDINGDDIVGDFASNKADNVAQLMNVNTNIVTIDGFIFENAHKPSGSNPAIFFPTTYNTSFFTLKNSIIRNNYVASGMLMDYRYFTDDIQFINVAVKGNLLNNGVALFQSSGSNTPINFNFVNFEFSDNQFNSDFGAIWFRETGTSSMTTNIVNSTFINNQNDFSTTTIKHLINISSSGSLENVVDVYNSIFYNNFYSNTSIISDIVFDNTKQVEGNFGDLDIDNCIAPTVNPSTANIDADAFNISTANPNLDSDYKPTASSTAVIDQGTNSFYQITYPDKDLSGNDRIFNTTIDLGAYEYSSTLSSSDFELQTPLVKIYPNPVSHRLFIESESQIESVSVYNVSGQLVNQFKTIINGIDVSHLQDGLYMIKIETSKNTINRKFVKN